MSQRLLGLQGNRYDPEVDAAPRLQVFELTREHGDRMLLDALFAAKRQDPSLALRRSVPVIRDLMLDLSSFFHQYHSLRPHLVNDAPPPDRERLQTPAQREVPNGPYGCINCACCSTTCGTRTACSAAGRS